MNERCVKILDVAAESDPVAAQQHEVHHVSAAAYLSLHRHLLAARHAAVRRTVRTLHRAVFHRANIIY